jgi:hypothetical protein
MLHKLIADNASKLSLESHVDIYAGDAEYRNCDLENR